MTDEQVRLRALEPTDVELLMRWENDTASWDTGSRLLPLSRHGAWEYLQRYDGDLFNSRNVRFVIEHVETGRAVGCIDITGFDPFHSRAEVGILIDADERGRGYAARALNLVADYALNFLGVHQLYAIIPADNEASQALFEHCGFTASGTLRHWFKRASTRVDAHVLQRFATPQ